MKKDITTLNPEDSRLYADSQCNTKGGTWNGDTMGGGTCDIIDFSKINNDIIHDKTGGYWVGYVEIES